jgi:hypothetical protein
MRFLTPPAYFERRIENRSHGQARNPCVRFHPDLIPPWPFSDLRGFYLRRTLQPCFVLLPLMGFLPFRVFPFPETSPGSSPIDSPLDVSRLLEEPAPRPQGVRLGRVRSPLPEYCIRQRVVTLMVVLSPSRLRLFGLPLGSHSLSTGTALQIRSRPSRTTPPETKNRFGSCDSWVPSVFPPTRPASPALTGAVRPGVLGLPRPAEQARRGGVGRSARAIRFPLHRCVVGGGYDEG